MPKRRAGSDSIFAAGPLALRRPHGSLSDRASFRNHRGCNGQGRDPFSRIFAWTQLASVSSVNYSKRERRGIYSGGTDPLSVYTLLHGTRVWIFVLKVVCLFTILANKLHSYPSLYKKHIVALSHGTSSTMLNLHN